MTKMILFNILKSSSKGVVALWGISIFIQSYGKIKSYDIKVFSVQETPQKNLTEQNPCLKWQNFCVYEIRHPKNLGK